MSRESKFWQACVTIVTMTAIVAVAGTIVHGCSVSTDNDKSQKQKCIEKFHDNASEAYVCMDAY